MVTRILIALLLASPAMAQTTLPGPRPFEQMRGDCSAFAMNVAPEAALWQAAATEAAAGTDADTAAEVVPGTVSRLALHAPAGVTFPVAPEQDRSAPDRFSGTARVTVPQAGYWRVSASNGLWFDAVAGGAIIPSAAFEMQTACAAPFKVVVYDLPAGTEILLQLNGSPSESVDLLVTPWTD